MESDPPPDRIVPKKTSPNNGLLAGPNRQAGGLLDVGGLQSGDEPLARNTKSLRIENAKLIAKPTSMTLLKSASFRQLCSTPGVSNELHA